MNALLSHSLMHSRRATRCFDVTTMTTAMRALSTTTTTTTTTKATKTTESNGMNKKDLVINVAVTYKLSVNKSAKIVNTILDGIVEVRECRVVLARVNHLMVRIVVVRYHVRFVIPL